PSERVRIRAAVREVGELQVPRRSCTRPCSTRAVVGQMARTLQPPREGAYERLAYPDSRSRRVEEHGRGAHVPSASGSCRATDSAELRRWGRGFRSVRGLWRCRFGGPATRTVWSGDCTGLTPRPILRED